VSGFYLANQLIGRNSDEYISSSKTILQLIHAVFAAKSGNCDREIDEEIKSVFATREKFPRWTMIMIRESDVTALAIDTN